VRTQSPLRRRLIVLGVSVALVAVTAPPVWAGSIGADSWQPRPATFGVAVTKDVPVSMSDGAVLDADVYRPALPDGQPAAGRFPVLLTQTPYNKNAMNPEDDYLVERGYVEVVADVRGTGSSEGVYDQEFSTRSQLDGKELVAWCAAQPWSTGKVGLFGESYYAINQLLTAAQQPPALKAIFPVVPQGDLYRSNFPGGYLTSLFLFSLLYAGDGAVPPDDTASDPQKAIQTVGTRPASLELQAAGSAGLLAGDAEAYDGPYYHAISPLDMIDRIKAPTFLVGGWYDALSQADAPKMFQALQAQHTPVKLLMGPWYHTTPGTGLPADGVAILDEQQLRWFDHWLRGTPDPALNSWGPVVYDQLGDGHYHASPSWPPPGINYQDAYLGGSTTPGKSGTLGARGVATSPDVLPWQPASGVCTRSTYIGLFGLAPSTPCETNDAANDATGLSYDLPVTRTMTLAGPMSAHLYVSSSRPNAFVTLHLEDLDPATGQANEITSGWDSLNMRALDLSRSTVVANKIVIPFHPDTKESLQAISPGTVYDWWIEIRPAAVSIPAGHVLRLSIQTSDAVRFLPTAPQLEGAVGGVLSVYHDAAHPSEIVLPVQS
jgi:uncharacterized protein